MLLGLKGGQRCPLLYLLWLLVFLVAFPLGQKASQSIVPDDVMQSPTTWYLGKGLGEGDRFTYRICDMLLRIPETSDHCYLITLEFVKMLRGPQGGVWIVQAEVNHQRDTPMILQIDADTWDVITDGFNMPYADSVSRTIFWIKKFANGFNQQSLKVGRSWGEVATYVGPRTELVVRERVAGEDLGYKTFVVGYNLAESTTLDIVEDLPFPASALVYKPTILHKKTPLEFSFRLIDYSKGGSVNFQHSHPAGCTGTSDMPTDQKEVTIFLDYLSR